MGQTPRLWRREGILYLVLSQTKGIGTRCEIERVSCSVLAAPSTRIDHTLSKASSAGPTFLLGREVAVVW